MNALPTIQKILGGYTLGTLVALVLYGIFIAQTYVYAMNCSKDNLYLKLCVTCIAVGETFHAIAMAHMIYGFIIDDFGNVGGIDRIVWSSVALLHSQMFIVAFVQSLYIRRIYILSGRNRIMTLILSLTLLALIADVFTSTALLFKYESWTEFRSVRKAFYSVVGGLALMSSLDVMIASSMIHYLWKSKTGFRSTDDMLHVLMAYCVNSGMITMLCSIVTILTFVFIKSSLLFVGFFQICSNLYANSLMGTLNARELLRQTHTAKRLPSTDEELEMRAPTPRQIEVYKLEPPKVVKGDSPNGADTVTSDPFVCREDGHGRYQESTKGYPHS
ncbi:hypothetical protein EUX98_g4173 [Antrodiella citrinella]|uniref:DUF6534 domain-containing protein n=1 Tax=Antrodiella citrinella TaxID=2447956 RepID=A0A4S4MUL9_9APHY|nr:hypothetical protein EUX98_g4173 [Antrodiella citrinella]